MSLQVLDHPRGERQFPVEYLNEWQAVIDGVPEGTALGTRQLRREGVGGLMRRDRMNVLKCLEEWVEFDGLAPTGLSICGGYAKDCVAVRARVPPSADVEAGCPGLRTRPSYGHD
jgi:hypothetical protein